MRARGVEQVIEVLRQDSAVLRCRRTIGCQISWVLLRPACARGSYEAGEADLIPLGAGEDVERLAETSHGCAGGEG